MARTVQQIQADLDTLNAAKANPVQLVRFPDGREVRYPGYGSAFESDCGD